MSNLTRYDFATEKGYNHYSQYFPTSIGMWVKFDDIKELLNSSHNSEGAPCEVAASCPVHRCRECRRYYDDMYQLT